jgi:erythromycin esterase
VLTGEGDPTRLLSTLRFWIWNTQEMLDMVRWMRDWNSTAPTERRVQFHGFDIQQPGGAMDTVEAFIARVDPARSSYVRSRFACFDFYKSYGATWGSSMAVYAIRLATSRAACALGAKEVHDLLAGNAAVYTAASSADTYGTALHSARLLQQWEAMATVTSNTNGLPASLSRDSSMAENIRWHRDRAGAGAKMVVWAHNDHIVRSSNMMGKHLRTAYGSDYLPVGFLFGTGTLNAVYSGSVQVVRPDAVPSQWIESTFISTGKAHLLLDTRLIASGGAAAAFLSGPIRMRSIGSTYSLSAPSGFYRSHSFPNDFDLLMFVSSGHETTVFPYVF